MRTFYEIIGSGLFHFPENFGLSVKIVHVLVHPVTNGRTDLRAASILHPDADFEVQCLKEHQKLLQPVASVISSSIVKIGR